MNKLCITIAFDHLILPLLPGLCFCWRFGWLCFGFCCFHALGWRHQAETCLRCRLCKCSIDKWFFTSRVLQCNPMQSTITVLTLIASKVSPSFGSSFFGASCGKIPNSKQCLWSSEFVFASILSIWSKRWVKHLLTSSCFYAVPV